jgi:hypothetical protein
MGMVTALGVELHNNAGNLPVFKIKVSQVTGQF